uniref:Uncharacterized protein n=1 Tax=Manihot esculenta TaxID=3983 RepID=A0A2C9UHX0_MANES
MDRCHREQAQVDLIYRTHRLVGERQLDLIAARIPVRKAEEIERFWIMRHHEAFADKSKTASN